MKKLILITIVSLAALTGFAQGNGKQKGKVQHDKNKQAQVDDPITRERREHDRQFGKYDEKGKYQGKKYSKNIPTKVRQSFERDFPYAGNVSWTKSKGNWTANFGNNGYRSIATYHANGERIDGRRDYPSQAQTPVPVPTVPRFPW